MSWVSPVAPDAAPAHVASTYERIRMRSSTGRVSNVWQTLANDPPGLTAAHAHAHALLDDPAPLTGAQAELIALVVSATNGCGYCVAHHGPKLARLIGEELAHAVAEDYRSANLVARDRILLDAAVALTCEPSERKLEDVERLREYGFSDAAIVRATALAAYFNFVNRVVSALGVELEPGRDAWSFGAQR